MPLLLWRTCSRVTNTPKFGEAATSKHAVLSIILVKALILRDRAAAESLASQQPLAAEVLSMWQDAERAAIDREHNALQQLVVGVAGAHKQLQAAAADITVSAVTAAMHAASLLGEPQQVTTTAAAPAAAASAAAVTAVADVAPLVEQTAATAAVAAAGAPLGAAGQHPEPRQQRQHSQQ
jgi:hypothetical protein